MRTIRLLPFLILVACALAPATAAASVTHTVTRGETLTSVAAADGLSVSDLAAANGLSPQAELQTGTRLVIPAQGAGVATTSVAQPAPVAAAPVAGGDVVVARGATLSALAAEYGTSVDALAADNGLRPDGLLLAGTTIQVPGAATTEAATSPASPATVAPAASVPAGGARPTAEFVSPETVGDLAAQDGVSPSLAEAIADQESGFDNDEVSSTGAIGVMQLEPQTWSDLTGPDGLSLSSESAFDNVRGGVAWLHGLLADTGGDEAETIAAYYQGLESVRRFGMFPDTQRYVRDVLALQGRY